MSWRAIWPSPSGAGGAEHGRPTAPRAASAAKRRKRQPNGAHKNAAPLSPDATHVAGGASGEHVDAADGGLALLGLASGAMDALAFFSLGEIFPSAMTGNTALLGLALGQGRFVDASRPFVALAGFLLGAALAAASVDLWLGKLPPPRAIWRLLAAETCLLAVFALAFQFMGQPSFGPWLYGLILVVASAMGVQSVAARLAARPGVTTVVFTSTLTSIVSAATSAMLRPPHRLPFAAKRQIGVFLAYGLGAALCGLLAARAPIAFMPLAAVLAALGLNLRAGRRTIGRT